MSKKQKLVKPNTNSESTIKPKEITEYLSKDNFLKNHWWKAIILIVLSLIIYYKTANYGYVLDDAIVIEDNNYTKKGFGGIWDLMTTESMQGYFGEQKNLVQGNRYRPLSLVTFAIEYGIFGEKNPGFSHIMNILLYALSCILLMRCFQLLIFKEHKLNGWIDIGFITAMLFCVHPLHVEAVANIKGRDEIMALLFSITALYFMVKHFMYGASKNVFYAGLLCYFLGLLSKENTITFLGVIPVSFYFFNDTTRKSSIIKSLLWLGLVTFIYLIFRFNVSGVPNLSQKINDLMNNPFLEMSGLEKLATITYTLGLYLKLLLVPYPLTHDYYPYAIPIMNWGSWKVLLSFLLYGAITYFGYKEYKKRSIVGYGIWFYLITLTIVSNIMINLGTFMNDRFIYMSSVGYCLILGWLIIKYLNNKIGVVVFALVTLTLGSLSFIRVPDWENAITLNRSAMKVSQGSARANTFMSTALFNEYKVTEDPEKKLALLNEAYPYALKSVEITPNYFNANLMLAGIEGERYGMTNNLDQLFTSFETAILNRPDVPFLTEYLRYLNGKNIDKNILLNFYHKVGRKLLNARVKDNFKWAIHYSRLGLEINPYQKELNQVAGEAYNFLGDKINAEKHLNIAAGQ